MLPTHLYIHIPFCSRRCSYCDFNTYVNMDDRIAAYVAALCRELRLLGARYAERLADPPAPAPASLLAGPLTSAALRPTVFFGGGTPSMLSLAQFEAILAAVGELLPLGRAEVTIEANPGSVLGNALPAVDYLHGLRALGINRLSFGVQTLHDPTLRVLGRTHTAAEARACYETARAVGFDSISLDFMFGLPGQTPDQWAANLAALMDWQPDHLSLYSLILEERTPLFAQVLGGQVQVPDDDSSGAMYEHAIDVLAAHGYTHYEVSNWSRTRPCEHNLAYWLNSDYLAAGAGAHGHIFPQRSANILGIDAYIQAVQAGRLPVASTTDLTHADLCAETMFMGLRLHAGVGRAHFQARCGTELAAVYGPTLATLEADGLVQQTPTAVHLTPRGRMLGNRVFEQFV